MEMIGKNALPHDWPMSANTPLSPQSYGQVLASAELHGYCVPDDEKRVGPAEQAAWYAASMIGRGRCLLSEWSFSGRIQEKVLQVTPQFVVPNPNRPTNWPFVLDQLWIVRDSHQSVRLLALEIDEEVHFETEENRNRTTRKDLLLTGMGYEVYHAAGWWCRIDPWRVIGEFLDLAGILPGIAAQTNTSRLGSTDGYVCDECGQKMIRLEADSIHLRAGKLVHDECPEPTIDSN
jgi:hypothetical protein